MTLGGVAGFHADGCNCVAGIEDSLRGYVDTPGRRQLQSLPARLKSAQ